MLVRGVDLTISNKEPNSGKFTVDYSVCCAVQQTRTNRIAARRAVCVRVRGVVTHQEDRARKVPALQLVVLLNQLLGAIWIQFGL